MNRQRQAAWWPWVLVAASLVVVAVSRWIRINPVAASAPAGIYLLMRGVHSRGAAVSVCLPETLGRLGRARGYLDAGGCAGGARPVGKRIVALAGDRVEVVGGRLIVNGIAVPGVRRLERDSAGRFIPAVPEGIYRVAPGTAWLVSCYDPRSWDSRYYGAVPVAEEAPVLKALVLFGSAGGLR